MTLRILWSEITVATRPMDINPHRVPDGRAPEVGGQDDHAPFAAQPPSPLAQTSTAMPMTMRYTANGANPRRRTQAMNQATLA